MKRVPNSKRICPWAVERVKATSSMLLRVFVVRRLQTRREHFKNVLHHESARSWCSQCTLQSVKVSKNRHCEWFTTGAPHWRADANRAWARRRTARARRCVEGRERARPNTEAGEAGQNRVNLRERLHQQGSQAREHARPPVLKAASIFQ